MKNKVICIILCALVLSILPACSASDILGPQAGPSPFPVTTPTVLPGAEVEFNLIPPEGTLPDEQLALQILDEVTGLAYNTTTHPMKRLEDGRWQVRVAIPVGSLVRYRYSRQSPNVVDEASAFAEPILYRVAHITGPMQVNDIAAAWTDKPYQGPVGRIIGRVLNAENDSPLEEVIVIVAGLRAFSDIEGNFRIDGLPPGLHEVSAFSPTGAFKTVHQGAVIAAESTTPVQLSLAPAKKVQVTFEVSVPSDTIPGTPLRIAGNVRQMGNTFGQMAGGLSLAFAQMPTMTLVTPTDYLAVVTLYSGTDLRYKYTLGDGLWNAERDPEGFFTTRQLIVPETDLIVKDRVSTWQTGNKGSIQFHVTVPENTPAAEWVSLQFNPFTWFEPLPMWRLDEDEWFFVLHSPLDFSGSIGYRYCRNLQCGNADDLSTAGPNSMGRPLSSTNERQDVRDQVQEWWWLEGELPEATVIAPEIVPRDGFEAGVELLPIYHPNWISLTEASMVDVVSFGSNAIVLTPGWMMKQNAPIPILAFDAVQSPYQADLKKIASSALEKGLKVTLRPTLHASDQQNDTWWTSATRDLAWWNVWFEQYRSFLLTFAKQAQQIGAHRLVISSEESLPAYPGGQLSDGTPSGVPQDAEQRWRALVSDLRGVFDGRIALEIELKGGTLITPPFLDAFDEIYVFWHAPLASSSGASASELQASVTSLLDNTLLGNPVLANMPLYLSVEYLSVQASVTACPKTPDGGCRTASAFERGEIVDPDLGLDLLGQAQAINAVLLEASIRPEVMGFYVRGYNPMVILHDKSASIHGKPARDILWYWYTHLIPEP